MTFLGPFSCTIRYVGKRCNASSTIPHLMKPLGKPKLLSEIYELVRDTPTLNTNGQTLSYINGNVTNELHNDAIMAFVMPNYFKYCVIDRRKVWARLRIETPVFSTQEWVSGDRVKTKQIRLIDWIQWKQR